MAQKGGFSQVALCHLLGQPASVSVSVAWDRPEGPGCSTDKATAWKQGGAGSRLSWGRGKMQVGFLRKSLTASWPVRTALGEDLWQKGWANEATEQEGGGAVGSRGHTLYSPEFLCAWSSLLTCGSRGRNDTEVTSSLF